MKISAQVLTKVLDQQQTMKLYNSSMFVEEPTGEKAALQVLSGLNPMLTLWHASMILCERR